MSACADSNLVLSDELIVARRKVADLLLHFAGTTELQRHFTQSESAIILGISWAMVNNSLISLKGESAVRIDRHKMTINKNKLERILIRNE